MPNYFIGTNYKIAYKTSKSFIWHFEVEFGYAHSENDMHTNKSGGLSFHSKMGIDYLIGKHFDFGIFMDAIQTFYPKSNGWSKRQAIRHRPQCHQCPLRLLFLIKMCNKQ